VKNFKDIDLVDQIIALDERLRQTKSQSEAIAAEANSMAKQIGDLMRLGKKEEAELIKSSSASYKEQLKEFSEDLERIEIELHDKLVQLPNLPAPLVPAGITPEDNEVVLEYGEIP